MNWVHSSSPIDQADLVVGDSQLLQQIVGYVFILTAVSFPILSLRDGFGAALTDCVALVLNNLPSSGGTGYQSFLGYTSDPEEVPSNPDSVVRPQFHDNFNLMLFHCYAGGVGGKSNVHNSYPGKDAQSTECAATIGSDKWTAIKWQTNTPGFGADLSALMWLLAAQPDVAGFTIPPRDLSRASHS
ncbi:glycoside hydrolase family 30 protein [Hydnum rufescens UP504]|uniref:Glycoside hydrolase family 30 protein n=1 Tax=Hydnum rufescens UP504 TaxID=1448309 RepID=A0A9P6DQD3_9AGAM|nr:glycoside hydrolase family 30 protein [Hydnum rufescens UP504]